MNTVCALLSIVNLINYLHYLCNGIGEFSWTLYLSEITGLMDINKDFNIVNNLMR